MNTLRRFVTVIGLTFPLRAATLVDRFRLYAFTSNLCTSRRTIHNQSNEIQTVGKREPWLGVAAANPLRGANIFNAPQIRTLGVEVSIRQHHQLHLVNQ